MIGGGACTGEVCPNTIEATNGTHRVHTRTQRFTPSQTILSVPGAIAQLQWSQHIKEDSFLKVMRAAGSWMRKHLAEGQRYCRTTRRRHIVKVQAADSINGCGVAGHPKHTPMTPQSHGNVLPERTCLLYCLPVGQDRRQVLSGRTLPCDC